MGEKSMRIERDLLGEKTIASDAYYGVQTARALENFHISGVELRLYPDRLFPADERTRDGHLLIMRPNDNWVHEGRIYEFTIRKVQ